MQLGPKNEVLLAAIAVAVRRSMPLPVLKFHADRPFLYVMIGADWIILFVGVFSGF